MHGYVLLRSALDPDDLFLLSGLPRLGPQDLALDRGLLEGDLFWYVQAQGDL